MANGEEALHWFNNAKGHRFLEQDDGPDVFARVSSAGSGMSMSSEDGQSVRHDAEQGKMNQRPARKAR